MLKLWSVAFFAGLLAVSPLRAAEPVVRVHACTAGVTNCALSVDGVFPAEGQQWRTGTAT